MKKDARENVFRGETDMRELKYSPQAIEEDNSLNEE
jgi:hypothetical protein